MFVTLTNMVCIIYDLGVLPELLISELLIGYLRDMNGGEVKLPKMAMLKTLCRIGFRFSSVWDCRNLRGFKR